jgi:hypothetical protein
VSGYPTAQAALDAAGVQLELGLRDEELGETVELADLDFDRLDAAELRLLDAIAALSKSRPCRCERPLVIDDGTDDPVCSKCGRAHGG